MVVAVVVVVIVCQLQGWRERENTRTGRRGGAALGRELVGWRDGRDGTGVAERTGGAYWSERGHSRWEACRGGCGRRVACEGRGEQRARSFRGS